MTTISLISTAALALTLAATANAAPGNGADGWRKLQQRQTGEAMQTAPQSFGQHASASEFAAHVIAANSTNYKR